mmetsp:Transcript_97648/g.183590  ORF Transcript_97648/g.183590 Transcript_97648/m.183590 type:complete len:216 (+) Transcript_97648:174-821(+)
MVSASAKGAPALIGRTSANVNGVRQMAQSASPPPAAADCGSCMVGTHSKWKACLQSGRCTTLELSRHNASKQIAQDSSVCGAALPASSTEAASAHSRARSSGIVGCRSALSLRCVTVLTEGAECKSMGRAAGAAVGAAIGTNRYAGPHSTRTILTSLLLAATIGADRKLRRVRRPCWEDPTFEAASLILTGPCSRNLAFLHSSRFFRAPLPTSLS